MRRGLSDKFYSYSLGYDVRALFFFGSLSATKVAQSPLSLFLSDEASMLVDFLEGSLKTLGLLNYHPVAEIMATPVMTLPEIVKVYI